MDMGDKFVGIDSRYRLRGWQGRPRAVVDTLLLQAHDVPEGVFGTLLSCDGTHRASDPAFIGRWGHLEALRHDGVLRLTDEPCPLEPLQEYRLHPNRYMRQVRWSLTGRCNYRCRHCFMSAPHGLLPQPTTEQCLRIADEIAEAGILSVRLTGGEPLIRPDFLEIVERLFGHGVSIGTILTNGSLVDEALLCSLEERGVRCAFDMSFDGTRGRHDWLRGVEGAGEAAVRAFELCREHGYPTDAEFVLHRGNAGVLRESVRLLGGLGVRGVVVGSVVDEGEAHGMREQILTPDEVFDIYCAYLPEFLEDGAPVPLLTLGGIFKVENGVAGLQEDRGHVCGAGDPACPSAQQHLYLSPDGYVLPCSQVARDASQKRRFPNVADMTVSQALNDPFYLRFLGVTVGDILASDPKCRACEHGRSCHGGCRASCVDGDGRWNLLSHDPRACEYCFGDSRKRARALVESLRANGA